jgi:magnesium-transporting ATPase (P-type)
MTFQPPPPGDNPPPPPPPGQWNAPGGGNQQFDPKSVNPVDWGILAAGFLTFIFSFISYYTWEAGPISTSTSAWHGFFGWFGALLALAAAAVVAMALFAPHVKLPWPNYLVALALFALAALCTLIALFTNPYPDFQGTDSGHGFGYWACLILTIAGTVMTLMRMQQTGGKLPGALGNMPNIGNRGSQGGIGGQNPPPPAP